MIVKKQNNNTIAFGSILPGEVFEYENGSFLKTEQGKNHNAVWLSDGAFAIFAPDSMVRVIKGHFQET